MFGMQRVGDLVWAAGDQRAKGFLCGGTSGRTTLAGEGLQHQDGHSHLLAYPLPNLLAYDPAFAYEIAVIVEEGIRRMYVEQEDILYYITVMNELWIQPDMPEGSREGILKGMYRFKKSELKDAKLHAQLFGSGAILLEVMKAAEILETRFKVATDIWSVTSYKELYKNGNTCEHWNVLHPGAKQRVPYVTEQLKDSEGVLVAASDYVKALPQSVSQWMPRPLIALGTDGFGRSESRASLRDFFQVDAKHIVLAALTGLLREGKIKAAEVKQAISELGIDAESPDPFTV
jgi:pyruvate dehydrogenase E1 component